MELGLCLTLCALGGAFWIPALVLTFIAGKRRRSCTAMENCGRTKEKEIIKLPFYPLLSKSFISFVSCIFVKLLK